MNANAGNDMGATSAGFSIVVAMDRNRGIGKDGALPWPKLKGDMKFFRELTTCPSREAVEKRWGLKPGESADVQKWEDVSERMKLGVLPLPQASARKLNAVIMGRKTAAGLPANFSPLPERENRILTRIAGAPMVNLSSDGEDWREADSWNTVWQRPQVQNAPEKFVIGGGQIFGEALNFPSCAHLYVTEIDAEFSCDTFFPEAPNFAPALSSPWIEENGIRYRFRRYDRT